MTLVIPPLIFEDEGFTLDLSHSGLAASSLKGFSELLANVHQGMLDIEAGKLKNTDEGRAVTHFTDRLTYEQTEVAADISLFFERLRRGKFSGDAGRPFAFIVINGIGGSALGPQFLQQAIRGTYWNEKDKFARDNYPRIYFLDNTDPQGIVDLLEVIELDRTFVVSISKSGGTLETQNNLHALEQAFDEEDLNFSAHAGAVTMPGSELDSYARQHRWRKIWAMSESIGGRTSITNVVGHVSAAATGIDFAAFLDGARTMDSWTREEDPMRNPAYLLATAWYVLGNKRGERNMVVLPYSDRLILLPRYLQQLVMESLGKAVNVKGETVHQGLTVYGNKGGSDAHAYVQQLQDGPDDFFITFIETLKDARQIALGELTMGDHLHSFLDGLMLSLFANERYVISITVNELNERAMGMLVALYERAVAAYAEMIEINAFNQPGVQAYKRVSKSINDINMALQHFVATSRGYSGSSVDFANSVGLADWHEEVGGILDKFVVNERTFGGCSISRYLVKGHWQYTVA